MDFEWDEAKSSRNLRERGFGFDFAALIFETRVLEARDDRADYAEDRIIAIGEADGVVMIVVYADRQNARRIILSAPG
ncbi:MAG: BrnT family toxin [Roseiarcus sp.]